MARKGIRQDWGRRSLAVLLHLHLHLLQAVFPDRDVGRDAILAVIEQYDPD